MAEAGAGRIGSVVGRYYAMDRDQRWDRVQRAYDLLVHGRAEHRADTGEAAARRPTSAARPTSSSRRCWSARRRGSAPATRCSRSTSAPTGCARSPARSPSRGSTSSTAAASGRSSTTRRMTDYEEGFPYPVAFAPEHPATTLPSCSRSAASRQLHVAETEKYAHVTYFFNGGDEEPCRASSAAGALAARRADLRLKPEMSAPRGGGRVRRRLARATRRLRARQLRQRGHGRAHRRDRGGGRGGRDRRPVPWRSHRGACMRPAAPA